ncbi:glycosyltransferase family 39 protein [Clostridium sp. cel8]|uniref:glycosyltransferase family 39 protein n=1 Tax=Clostridium sp. cel8 TaxID=2663123 RepID=UPI0015F44382|nr:glycosyltransferase family 39 protein [Clostridium sp. cel8]MBA5851590.1 glycosyltransferase family 39 protein [Clostridium sp. cel8]
MKKIKFTKEKIAISLILILSAILNFTNLTIQGYSNLYYASGVKSMLLNFTNFFFVSFDPAGFVSIDKPPLGFWMQAISAKIFGFSGVSILLPQALAGVISVGLLYYLVKRSFGPTAGILSALFLAITPVFVAASRNNTIDNLLVMTLLFACIFLSKAAERGKFKYLIISLILVGIGFNIKMLEAYMIAPAMYITYLISTAAPIKKKIVHLIVGTMVLAVVSLSWAFVVDLVPSQNRPYVGSSTNNTVTELIFGHNGVARLSSSKGGGGRGGNGQRPAMMNKAKTSDTSTDSKQNLRANGPNSASIPNANSGNAANSSGIPGPGNGGGTPGGGGGAPGGSSSLSGNFGGQTPSGITRLFSKNILSDQICWFIPLAFLGFIASLLAQKFRLPFNNKKKLDLVLWIFWLLPEFIYFSFTTGLFHPYYLTMMAPPIAALSGIGITSMWKLYKEGGIKSYLLPVSFILEGILHLVMLSYFIDSISSTITMIIITAAVLSFISSIGLIIYKLVKQQDSFNGKNFKFAKTLTALALIGILTTPAIGSAAVINHAINGSMPAAGLELLSDEVSNDSSLSINTKLIEFIKSNAPNTKYQLVVSDSQSADSIILGSDVSVIALGGFSGSDNILTLSEFKELVKNGDVRYVLSSGSSGRSSIMQWVQENGKEVPKSEWSNTSSNTDSSTNTTEEESINAKDSKANRFGKDMKMGMNSQTLYDLKGTVN